ncbi:hypothetical protein AAG906_034331 [Vitis piasezkii]
MSIILSAPGLVQFLFLVLFYLTPPNPSRFEPSLVEADENELPSNSLIPNHSELPVNEKAQRLTIGQIKVGRGRCSRRLRLNAFI